MMRFWLVAVFKALGDETEADVVVVGVAVGEGGDVGESVVRRVLYSSS